MVLLGDNLPMQHNSELASIGSCVFLKPMQMLCSLPRALLIFDDHFVCFLELGCPEQKSDLWFSWVTTSKQNTAVDFIPLPFVFVKSMQVLCSLAKVSLIFQVWFVVLLGDNKLVKHCDRVQCINFLGH